MIITMRLSPTHTNLFGEKVNKTIPNLIIIFRIKPRLDAAAYILVYIYYYIVFRYNMSHIKYYKNVEKHTHFLNNSFCSVKKKKTCYINIIIDTWLLYLYGYNNIIMPKEYIYI